MSRPEVVDAMDLLDHLLAERHAALWSLTVPASPVQPHAQDH